MGAGWWIFGVLFMIFCMLMMGRMMMGHGMHHSHTGASSGYGRDRPEQTLANRLARGEIDVDEYEQRLAVLQRSRDLNQTENGPPRVE